MIVGVYVGENVYFCKPDERVMPHFLTISTSIELVRVAAEHIVYVSPDGNYSLLRQRDGVVRQLSCNLHRVEELISEQLGEDAAHFVRLGRNHIINMNYVNYLNLPKQSLTMSDAATFSYELTASREQLVGLKKVLEQLEGSG